MHVDVRAQTDRAAFGPRPPIVDELVPKQQLSLGGPQARIPSRRALPDARVVADERLVRRAAKVLPRDETVRHVLAGEGLVVDARDGRDELVAVHIAADGP